MENQLDQAETPFALAHLWYLRAWTNDVRQQEWLDSARAYYRLAAERSPQNPRVWSGRSAVAAVRGDFVTALSDAKRALELDPYLDARNDILMRLFTAAFNLNQDSLAGEYCSEINDEMPHKAAAASCALLMEAWSTVRVADRTTDDLRSLLDINEPDEVRTRMQPMLRLQLAAALARRGERAAAAEIIAQIPVSMDAADTEYFRAAALTLLDRTEDSRNAYVRVHSMTAGSQLDDTYPRISRAIDRS
jgi:tetratricopeptide (TPR) repeat protein